MKGKILSIGIVVGIVICLLFSTGNVALAGDPSGPGTPPNATNSYTLENVYNSLNIGTGATQGTFTEPTVGPGTGTMHTLDDLYDLTRHRAPVPKTGQAATPPFVFDGTDASLTKGVAWPNPRFTDNNNNGTVTDNLTGLIWLKQANCPNLSVNWSNALALVSFLSDGMCGLTDGSTPGQWRMPNVRELLSLVHYGLKNPALSDTLGTGQWTEGNPFTGVLTASYWASSSYIKDQSNAWLVYLGDGDTHVAIKTTGTYHFWSVRGGQ